MDNVPDGILSRQVLRSPIIKWIITARIRSATREDIVFVYDTRIELYEVTKLGQLVFVARKDDFDCRILAVQVLGDISTTASKSVKEEDLDENSMTDHGNIPPPQHLVLTLDIPQLLVLHAVDTENTTSFHSTRLPLPLRTIRDDSFLVSPTKWLAIAPQGSALAVAAWENTVIAYNLRSLCQLHTPNDKLFEDDFHISVPRMSILNMAFLHPPASDIDRVTLLVLGLQDRKSVIYIYSWNTSSHRSTADNNDIRPFKQVLGKEHSGVPLLLIPLTHPAAFLIVDERVLAIYQYLHDGSIQQMHCESLKDKEQDWTPTSNSLRTPLWTTWSRPNGPKQEPVMLDVIYLAREDGLVRYLEIEKTREGFYFDQDIVQATNVRIDSAFTATRPADHSADLVIVGGCGCNGAVFKAGFSDDGWLFDAIHIIDNWAPFTTAAGVLTSITLHEALMVTSGTSTGSIVRFEYVASSSLIPETVIEDLAGVTDVWSMFDKEQDNPILVCSFPWESIAVVIGSELMHHVRLGDEPTLALLPLCNPTDTETRVVQITSSGIRTLNIDQIEDDGIVTESEVPMRVVLAATSSPYVGLVFLPIEKPEIVNNDATMDIKHGSGVISEKKAVNDFHLLVKKVTAEPTNSTMHDLGSVVIMQDEPTCMSFLKVLNTATKEEKLFIGLGYDTGVVKLYSIDPAAGMAECVATTELGFSVESIGHIISRTTEANDILLLCGLRCGDLIIQSVTLDADGKPVLGDANQAQNEWKIGSTPVRVVEDTQRTNGAFLFCDERLNYIEHRGRDGVHIKRIRSSEGKGESRAVCRLSSGDVNLCDADSRVVLARRDGVVISDLQSLHESPYLRPEIPEVGTPFRIVYSAQLQAIITASIVIEVDATQNKRYAMSRVDITPSERQGVLNLGDQPIVASSSWTSEAGERLTDVIEWKWPKKRTSSLLVATFKYLDEDSQERGLVKYLKVDAKGDQCKMTLVHESRESDAAYCAAQYGDDVLVYGCGLVLRARNFDKADKRFDKGIACRLPSPAVFITTGEYIYVTLASHSVRIFDIIDGRLQCIGSDFEARPGISHLVLESSSTILCTTKENAVFMLIFGEDTAFSTTSNMIEVSLPCSLTRLVKANIRPRWMTNASIPMGVIDQDIFGMATDGSIWHFTILDEDAAKVLQKLERLLETSNFSVARQGYGRRKSVPNHPRASDRHIRGDLLHRLLATTNPRQVLDDLIANAGADVSQTLQRDFEEVLRQSTDMYYMTRKLDALFKVDSVQAMVEWLRHLLDECF